MIRSSLGSKKSSVSSEHSESRDNPLFTVYILRTSSNTLYIGQTNNLEKRLHQHKKKLGRSARYIRYFSSFNLVYKESYATRIEAMRRELQLKKWPKAKKEALIYAVITLCLIY